MCICMVESASLGIFSPVGMGFLGALAVWRMTAYSAVDFIPHVVRSMDVTLTRALVVVFGAVAYGSAKLSLTALPILAVLHFYFLRGCAEAGEEPGPVSVALCRLAWAITVIRAFGL